MDEPVTTLDTRFSDADAVATDSNATRRALETAELFWISTVRTDGGEWRDGRHEACPPHGGDAFAQYNSATAVYQDNVQSWSTVEPALDLTVASPLAFAWQVSDAPRFP